MSIWGKFHEVSMYGLISLIVAYATGLVSSDSLLYAASHPDTFNNVFIFYLFWSSVLFIPIAVIGAFQTKYGDGGVGLSFNSDKVLVILFAHIAEEILGLVRTPVWFIKDLITKSFEGMKVLDYFLYFMELIFIALGFMSLQGFI